MSGLVEWALLLSQVFLGLAVLAMARALHLQTQINRLTRQMIAEAVLIARGEHQ